VTEIRGNNLKETDTLLNRMTRREVIYLHRCHDRTAVGAINDSLGVRHIEGCLADTRTRDEAVMNLFLNLKSVSVVTRCMSSGRIRRNDANHASTDTLIQKDTLSLGTRDLHSLTVKIIARILVAAVRLRLIVFSRPRLNK
jgi:hypothetical protein